MNEVSVTSLIQVARKCLWGMILCGLAFAVAAYAYCSLIVVPTYQAKGSFIATNGAVSVENETTTKISGSDVNASLSMLNTYVSLMQTNKIYNNLAEHLGNGYNARDLQKMISVDIRDEDTLFIDVSVTANNPQSAVKILNQFLSEGEQYIPEYIPDAKLKKVEDATSATVNKPNTAFYVLAALIFGCVLIFIITFLVSLMDNTIKGEEDFSAKYDIPILGNIPNFKAAARGEKRYEK